MLPLFHITGLNLALATLHAGGKNVVTEKFNARQALELTESEKITLFGSFAPILSRLLSELDKGSVDVSSWRNVTGLEPIDIAKHLEEKSPATFWPLYGQSETSGTVTLCPSSDRPGSAGRPGLLSAVGIADENDQLVPKGDTGEIIVRGPLVFQGYWKQDELNQYTFRNDWHHTGDLGKFDDDGYLWFAGRKPEKELIKPGGENVYPAEVEDVILQHDDVSEVSVIGVPDPEFGEGIKAVCVLKQGSSLTSKELIEFVAGKIARYKKPKYVEFVSDLPKTGAGDIDRVGVKSLYGNS
jgi:acyl-CoA synthetase (AMP-forming)/AMP-acid ligase II